MREIKFRAWDKRNKRFLDDADWYLHPTNGPTIYWNPEVVFPEDLELLQFTGLKDKNGKEIYEGDILSSRGYRLVVKFDKGIFYAETYGGYRLSLEEIHVGGRLLTFETCMKTQNC